MGNGRVYGGGAHVPRPRGYALPGQGDRSPPKQVVVRGLGHIESAPAVFGYFRPVESTAPQATHKTVTASARLFCVFPYSRPYGRSLNPTFLLCKRKVPLTVPKKTSRGCSDSPPAPPQLPLFRGETYGFLPCRGGITPLSLDGGRELGTGTAQSIALPIYFITYI